jgi:hypothetical protein
MRHSTNKNTILAIDITAAICVLSGTIFLIQDLKLDLYTNTILNILF